MPIIQLDFGNYLNTSVQIGDIAYFANTIAVGPTGDPAVDILDHFSSTGHIHDNQLNPPDWLPQLPVPPHETASKEEIIKIGKIIAIIPFDGTKSSIQCDMPQDLFNKYFNSIVAGCVNTNPIDILITDTAFTDTYGQDPSCLLLTQFSSMEDLLDTAFSVGNYNTPFVEIGKFPFQCNPLQGANFVDNNIFNCNDGLQSQSLCWAKVGNINLVTGGLVQFYNAFSCLDHLISNNGWNLTLTSSFTDVVNEATNQGISFPEAAGFPPCYCQDVPLPCDSPGSFIMFSKDNKANQSDLLGYYASVEYRNNSTTEAELYNVGTSFYESSK
jgi:hypothetical protein